MARKKTEIIDDDGNELAPPEPGSPIANIIYLLEYGRRRGFRIGPTVQVNDVIVQVSDLRQENEAARQVRGPASLEDDPDMAVLLGGQGSGT